MYMQWSVMTVDRLEKHNYCNVGETNCAIQIPADKMYS